MAYEIYGLPNRVMTSLSSKLFENENLSKMLYYTDKKYENLPILNEKRVSFSTLKGNHIFIGRRVPVVLKKSGAFVSFRVFNYYQHNKNGIYIVEIDIDTIVHQDCMNTTIGTRDITIATMIIDSIENSDLSGIGKCDITSTYDIRDLDAEYNGYTTRVRIEGYKKDINGND